MKEKFNFQPAVAKGYGGQASNVEL